MQSGWIDRLGNGSQPLGGRRGLCCRCLAGIDPEVKTVAHANGRGGLENESPNQGAGSDQHDSGKSRKLEQRIGRKRNC